MHGRFAVLLGGWVAGAPAWAATTLISHAYGTPATSADALSDIGQRQSSISGDGRYVVFTSRATNLVQAQADSSGTEDVFLFDRTTGLVTLVSHSSSGAATTANAASTLPQISVDGAYVVFVSAATDLVAGVTDGNGAEDVFLYTRATGVTTLVSRSAASATTAGNAASSAASLSGTGAYVAFHSNGTDLVASQSDSNAGADVFLFEPSTGAMTLVSHAAGSATTTSNGGGFQPLLSRDGSYVAFGTHGTDLVSGVTDSNAYPELYLYNRATGATTLITRSASNAAATADRGTSTPTPIGSISGDGRFVAYQSQSENLAGTNTNGFSQDVFLFDRIAGTNTLVSHAASSTTTTSTGESRNPRLSDDGGALVYESFSGDLVAGQTQPFGNTLDVFAYNRASGTNTLVSHRQGSPATTGNGLSCCGQISRDGSTIAFSSDAPNIRDANASANPNAVTQVYANYLTNGEVRLLSHSATSTTQGAGDNSVAPAVSGDGSVVAFSSLATNLVAGTTDTNGTFDAFLSLQSVPSAPSSPGGGGGGLPVALLVLLAAAQGARRYRIRPPARG